MGIINNLKNWVFRMFFGAKTIEEALDITVIKDQQLANDQLLWSQMIEGKAPWNCGDDSVPSLMLASSICKEAARNAIVELKCKVAGSPRADYINEQIQAAIDNAMMTTQMLTGGGRLLLKPYVRRNNIDVTNVANQCYYPVKYNEVGELTSCVSADRLEKGDLYYTLLELHEWDEMSQTYTITYKAFESKREDSIGKEVPLVTVDEWAHLVTPLEFINVEQPLFVDVCLPDMRSLFADAVEIIREADEQFARVIWEYASGERALDVDVDLFEKVSVKGKEYYDLPKGNERLYRSYDAPGLGISVFSPAFRDESIFKGINEYKRMIEFTIGFAYGIISDPNQVEKTAEEVRSTKHRFYVTIKDIQKTLEGAYKKLAKSMDILASIYKLVPEGKYEISLQWGDSVLEDPDKEYVRRKEMVSMGLMKPETFLSWYFDTSEEEALKLIPEMEPEVE